jgi:hypothetical protein
VSSASVLCSNRFGICDGSSIDRDGYGNRTTFGIHGRLITIIIIIMVLEIKVPLGASVAASLCSLPIRLTGVLSFVNMGIFWNNHHRVRHAAGP